MNALNKLLDKAKETRSLPSDLALAAQLGKSRQLVSEWRKGQKQIQDDDIAHLAKLAHEDGGQWLLLIHAEQAHGPAAKEWASLLRKFGAAAAVAAVALIALGVIDLSANETIQSAAILNAVTNMHYAKWIIGAAATAWALHNALSRQTGSRRDASSALLA